MYPHRLYVVQVTSSRDEDGYVTSSEGAEEYVGPCRLETQGRASVMAREDGTQVYTTATIYAKSVEACLCSGKLVSVRDGFGRELLRKQIINFSRTQLHVRIWV